MYVDFNDTEKVHYFFANVYILIFSAPGGWSEEKEFSCEGSCGNPLTSYKKECDNPKPSQRYFVSGPFQGWRRTGEKCSCNASDETEFSCDGISAIIIKPCIHCTRCIDELCK